MCQLKGDEINSNTKSSDQAVILLNNAAPIQERMVALFVLRTLADLTSFDAIIKCMTETAVDKNSLLEHELAYVLGQMCGVKDNDVGNPEKNQKRPDEATYTKVKCALEEVLQDTSRNSVVRHEAGEALAAMLSFSSKQLLKDQFEAVTNPSEVTETCDLAYQRLLWAEKVQLQEKERISRDTNPTISVDPAPPFLLESGDSGIEGSATIDELMINSCKELVDAENSIWRRYRALFTLRNQLVSCNVKSDTVKDHIVQAFSQALHCPSSALLRHEIGYVLGQVISGECLSAPQLEELTKSLESSVELDNEHPMVRHESAMALGEFMEIPSSTQMPSKVKKLLTEYAQIDGCPLLSDSCIVALSMMENDSTWTAVEFTPS